MSAVHIQDPELLEGLARPFTTDRNASVIGCWAMSEPHPGSEVLAIGATEFRYPQMVGDRIARAEGDTYVLGGRKSM